MSAAERELEHDDEHQVTPLELFFDLVFVFAMTQVTSLLADDPTWGGVLRGMLVLAALWWAWSVYAWLTSMMDVDEGGVRLAMLASFGAMLVVALAVPGAFGDDAVIFGVAYLAVRILHLVLSTIVSRDDPDRWSAIVRFVPTALLGASLLVLAGFLEGDVRIAVWLLALAIDYLGPVVIGVGGGWQVAPDYLHLPMIAGIVLFALGLKTTLGHVGEPLETVAAVGLCGGAALYLLGHIAFLFRSTGRVFRRRTIGAAVLLALVPAAVVIPALAALALVSAVCSLVVAYEALRYRTDRIRIRHPEPAA